MNILIFGASGATGYLLVKQALKQEHKVTAFMRSPSNFKLKHLNLKVVQGNIINYEQVEDVIKEKEVIISALGAASAFRYDADVVCGMANIIKAMELNSVSRLIYMSFIGIKETRANAGFFINNLAPLLLSTEIKGHQQREEMIKNSNLNWTIVRPPTLTNGNETGHYRSGENIFSKGFTASVSRADVAHFMISAIAGNHFSKKAVSILP